MSTFSPEEMNKLRTAAVQRFLNKSSPIIGSGTRKEFEVVITRFPDGTPQTEALRIVEESEGPPEVPEETGEFVEPKQLPKAEGGFSNALALSWIGLTYAAAAVGGYYVLGENAWGPVIGIALWTYVIWTKA